VVRSPASGDPADARLNKGFIVTRLAEHKADRAGRTFIVTGQQRSGTSLVASVLRRVGIFMGTAINDNVHEDEALAKLLLARDREQFRRAIHERDAAYGTWGFKLPMLCDVLAPADFALFTNPHIIVPFRDPVSVAVRQTLSDYRQPMPALRGAVDALAAMVAFVDQLDCPTLLLSYEKSLVFPADFIDAIVGFCDLPRGDAMRAELIALIEPNRKAYIDGVRRQYTGIIERRSGSHLLGWSHLTGSADPVALELSADGQPVLAFQADLFRPDLLEAGYGTGHHGFELDLRGLNLRPDSIIRIQVATHGIALRNSGQPLSAYAGA
jgi:hypothetical protein